jgi:hypothetical protein
MAEPAPMAPVQPSTEPAVIVAEGWPVYSEIIWFRTEYLLWSLPSSKMNWPVVTTGDPANPCAGIIGQPDTQVLFGNQDFLHDSTGGLRFNLGAWIDSDHIWGAEATGFAVFRENHVFERTSDANGTPPIYLPAFNTQCALEDAAIIADPMQMFGGGVRVNTDLSLWGLEASALYNLRRTERFEWSLLSGVRYLEMKESFNLSAVSRDLILNQQITLDDQFETNNQFLGYQLGSRMRWQVKRFLFDLTGKFAIGGNYQTRAILGQSSSSGPDATNPGAFPGGFYAQPSNIGKINDTVLAVMPALELKLAYQITPRFLASVGYDLFYLNQTIRVANQIDRNLDLSQNAVLGSGLPTGLPRAPQRVDNSSDLFVQGLSLGLEIRY